MTLGSARKPVGVSLLAMALVQSIFMSNFTHYREQPRSHRDVRRADTCDAT